MKVENMTGKSGRAVPNQFIISCKEGEIGAEDGYQVEYFQSYNSVIVKIVHKGYPSKVYIDEVYWDYSVTTGKYRNQFLGETKKETQAKIDSGEYILTNLN